MNAAVPVPVGPLPETLPAAIPDHAVSRPELSVVPPYRRPVCRCMPCVLAVADHHHQCPYFRPA
jgi:hypothetical protein